MPVIKIRRGTTTQWNASTRVLQVGELGIDTTLNRIKAGNGTNVWSALPYLSLSSTEIEELSQDAVSTALAAGTHSNITVTYSDNGNSISLATGPDVITQTSLSNTLTNPTSGYVAIGDVGVADGVASLDSNGKIPDSEIPSTIARDSEIPSLTGYATETYVGTAISNLVDAAPATLNTLNELAAALGDDANYAATITTALGLKAATADIAELAQDAVGSSLSSLFTYNDSTGGISLDNAQLSNFLMDGASGNSYGLIGTSAYLDVKNTNGYNKEIELDIVSLETKLDTDGYIKQAALDLKLNSNSPSVDYYIANSGTGSYTVNGVANGLITFERGKKYRIHMNASGHPFWIQTVSGAYSSGDVYSTGITNGGEDAGYILIELPQNAPDNLYYACEFHSSMAGSISVQSNNAITTNAQASNYTIAPIDAGRLIEMSGGGTLTITDSASFPIGFYVDVLQTTTSQVTIAGTSFTPDATPGLKLRARWSSATLIKRALDSWVVLGDLSA
jgi:hypothetical protein